MQAVVSSCVCSVFFSAALSAVFSPILDEVLPGLPFVTFLLDGFPVCAAFSPSAFFAFSLTVLLVLLHLPLFLCDWARKSMCSSLVRWYDGGAILLRLVPRSLCGMYIRSLKVVMLLMTPDVLGTKLYSDNSKILQ